MATDLTARAAKLARFGLGATSAFSHAVRGLALDSVAAVSAAAERLGDLAAGRSTPLSTLPVRVLILADERGRPLLDPGAVDAAMVRADRILTEGAHIRVRHDGVRVISEPAPTEALDPRANKALLLDHVRGRTDFITRMVGRPRVLGIVGDPITVVVVRSIAGTATGCSLGVTADWVICEASLFDGNNPGHYDETVLAHELGHALNLPHLGDPSNLMYPVSSPPGRIRGTALRRWQAVALNANRHVIPGR